LRGLRRILRVLARPTRVDRGRAGIVIQPYRGYGSSEEIFVMGRVLRQFGEPRRGQWTSLARDLLDIGRRVLRRGVKDATVCGRILGTEQRVCTDRDGYFRLALKPREAPPGDRHWHRVELTLESPVTVESGADVFIPSARARHVVISDIDDTVMVTGVANRIAMLTRLFLQGADSRVAFPGVGAFYRALYEGVDGAEHNPMLYVSRAPWSLYEVLDEFFRLHRIPVGPILFLREWGISLRSPLPRRAEDHKQSLIEDMLARYPDLPFVLIGDSGQHDPEVYAQLVHRHPGRVKAIYIRNISRDPTRGEAIEALAREVLDTGSSLLLAADSYAMARHAVEHDLIPAAALAAVNEERAAQEPEQAFSDSRQADRADSPDAAQQALEAGDQRTPPPSVEVERRRSSHTE